MSSVFFSDQYILIFIVVVFIIFLLINKSKHVLTISKTNTVDLISGQVTLSTLCNRLIVYEFPKYCIVRDRIGFENDLIQIINECRSLSTGLTFVFVDITNANLIFYEIIQTVIDDIIKNNNIACKLIFPNKMDSHLEKLYHHIIDYINQTNNNSIIVQLKDNTTHVVL